MDRVQVGAIALAAVMLVLWWATLPDAPPRPSVAEQTAPAVERPPTEEDLDMEAARAAPLPTLDDAAVVEPAGASSLTLENDAVRLVLSSAGGRFESVALKTFDDRLGDDAGPVELATVGARGTGVVLLGDERLRGLEAVEHEVVEQGARSVTLRVERDGVSVERQIELDESGHGGWVRIRIRNQGTERIEPAFQLLWYGQERAADAPDRFQNYSLVALADGSVKRRRVAGLGRKGFFGSLFGREIWAGETYGPDVEWAGVESQYFLMAAIPENPGEAVAFLGPIGADQGVAALRYPPFPVPPGRQLGRNYRVYFGPKLEEEALAVDLRLADGLRTGWAWIRPLVTLFGRLLAWTHGHVVANYGLAIILLTILLRLLTFPLTQKSMKSMRRFSVLAPEMKALQEKYKGDNQRLHQEMMSLYRRHGVNPIAAMGGGCLPMLIQFPFLVALYFALQGSIELRHAPFVGWIQDLSAPESFFSIAGMPIRLLPLMMGATMVLQQKMTPTAGADPQQRQMMMWMSVMFIFLFYQFPSGLVLYWFVSNLLGIAQQAWVNRQPAAARAA